MNVQITESFEPIDEGRLRQFENRFGIELPQDYREFLLAHNGGKPKPSTFDVDMRGFKNTDLVQHFLGLHETETENLSRYFQVYREQGLMPHNLLPIAVGLAHDLICLSVAGDDYGKVYYWDADWAIQEGKPRYHNVHLVADSFIEFLDRLYDDED